MESWKQSGLKRISMHVLVSLSIYLKRTEKVMMIDQEVIEGVGTEHDVNGIE